MHFWAHLKTVHRHRALVRKYCFRLGLYWQGLTHDLSKYSPVEFWAGVKYFQGDHSPNDAQRKAWGYSASWMHHKGRNRHHFEYWTDYSLSGEGISGVEMPRAIREILTESPRHRLECAPAEMKETVRRILGI